MTLQKTHTKLYQETLIPCTVRVCRDLLRFEAKIMLAIFWNNIIDFVTMS